MDPNSNLRNNITEVKAYLAGKHIHLWFENYINDIWQRLFFERDPCAAPKQ